MGPSPLRSEVWEFTDATPVSLHLLTGLDQFPLCLHPLDFPATELSGSCAQEEQVSLGQSESETECSRHFPRVSSLQTDLPAGGSQASSAPPSRELEQP